MQTPEFLRIADILEIHQILIDLFGGMPGIRDEGLLESALSQPQATFFGELLHPTIHEQAAAYLYHIAKNQVAQGEMSKEALSSLLGQHIKV